MFCLLASFHAYILTHTTAFADAGLVVSVFCLLLVSSQSYTTSVFLLETCARAEALENAPVPGTKLPRNYSMAIRQRKFELPALTKMFLGSAWSRFFSLTASMDLYGITWTFCAVFGQNLAQNLPIWGSDDDDNDLHQGDYKFYVGIFLLVGIPLSCLSILDQLWVQMVFLAARMGMVCMMIVTLLMAFAHPNEEHFDVRPTGAALASGSGFATFASLIAVLQTCVFSGAFQFSIPGVASISANHKTVGSCVRTAVLFAFSTNVIVATLAAYYFGKNDIEASNNLNWLTYVGPNDSVGAKIVSNYVVLMAAMDGLAVYPLNAIPLGEGLMTTLYGDRTEEMTKNKWVRISFRILASLPQGIGALFVSDLGILAKYAGIFTLLSYTTCPALLYLMSGQKMKERNLPTSTYYSENFLSSPVVAYGLVGASILLVAGVVIDSTGLVA